MPRWSFIVLITGFCASLLCAPVRAQTGKLIIVENADSLVGRVIEGEAVRELIGNVRFSQENIHVSCDRALQFIESGRVDLSGNVIVRDDSITMRAPVGTYHRDSRTAEAFRDVSLDDGHVRVTAGYGQYFVDPKIAAFRTNVVVRDTGSIVLSDSLTYFRQERRSVALGNVSIYSRADNVTITGDHLENLASPPYSRVTGAPVLIQFDTSAAGRIDTLVVHSRVMESFTDSVRRRVATDSVEISRGGLSAVAGRAVFFTEGDSITLRIAPIVWYLQSQINGDSIDVYLQKRKLSHVKVRGDAMAVSRSSPRWPGRFDQMTGGKMDLYFADQELQRIRVEGQATSLYHLYEDTTANGMNRTSGDSLVMGFEGRKVASITVYGGVEGRYVPEKLLRGHEREYLLTGFNWHEERPRARREDFRARTGKP